MPYKGYNSYKILPLSFTVAVTLHEIPPSLPRSLPRPCYVSVQTSPCRGAATVNHQLKVLTDTTSYLIGDRSN